MRRAAHLLKSATSEGRKSNQEMIPSPDFRMAGSGYIVVETHGAEGCVAHAQESRRRRQNRHSYGRSRAKRAKASSGSSPDAKIAVQLWGGLQVKEYI